MLLVVEVELVAQDKMDQHLHQMQV